MLNRKNADKKEKWFQVTNFPVCSPAVHARHELGDQSCRATALQLPAPGFAGCDSTLSGSPAHQIARSRFTRDGLSLACKRFRSPGPPLQDQRSRPSASRFTTSLVPGPVCFPTPSLARFRIRGRSTQENPLPSFQLTVPASCPVRAPLQDFHPSGSPALRPSAPPRGFATRQQVNLQDGLPLRNARSLFAPHRVSPMAHRSESATFRLAHCSACLLEPSAVWLQSVLSVKGNLRFSHNSISFAIKYLSASHIAKHVNKTFVLKSVCN